MARERERDQQEPFQERVVHIARVAKVVKGGRRFSFSALVVVGDGKSKVGFGMGKAGEVPDAIRKGAEHAKKNMRSIPRAKGTIPFDVVGQYGSCKVVMSPAKTGKGIIAGGPVRIIVDLAGINDISCKVHGTKNHQNVVRATFNGFEQMERLEDYAARRDLQATDIIEDYEPTANPAESAGQEGEAQ